MIFGPTPPVTRLRRWLPILCGALLLAVALGWELWRPGSIEMFAKRVVTSASSTGLRPLPALPGASGTAALPSQSATASAAGVPTHETILARVSPLMNEWRSAIVNKDANTVETLDQIFASHPLEFVPALMASAESDPEQRVRSFSTRVLGKLRPPESSELMRRLLRDPSEYVRFNAAWALGELVDREAVPGLRHLEKRDPSPSVRRSAEDSLRKIGGG